MRVALDKPEKMNITDPDGKVCVGGSQRWYKSFWRRMSGCGPVAAANLIWYKLATHGIRSQYIELMERMFTYVTPGIHGVNTSAIFTEGIMRYSADMKMQYSAEVLEIPKNKSSRPGIGTACGFITAALQADSPLAFLNLSSGSVKSIDSWHWVTITAFDADTMHTEICDYGKQTSADISEWMETSKLGGALVYLL